MKRLYKGHRGPGVGPLKADHPELRDGDSDGVVDERLPRKTDHYEPSPVQEDRQGDFQAGGDPEGPESPESGRPEPDAGPLEMWPSEGPTEGPSALEPPDELATEPTDEPTPEPTTEAQPTRLSSKYATIMDSLRGRGEQLAANLQPTAERLTADLRARGQGLATNIRPAAARLADRAGERAGQVKTAVGIAAEEYAGGKPKPKRTPKPKPVSPRRAELNDKYRRIMEVFRPASPAAPPRRQNRARSNNLKTPTRGPGIKIVDKE